MFADQLSAHRASYALDDGVRRRGISLLTLAHLRKGDTYADLTCGLANGRLVRRCTFPSGVDISDPDTATDGCRAATRSTSSRTLANPGRVNEPIPEPMNRMKPPGVSGDDVPRVTRSRVAG